MQLKHNCTRCNKFHKIKYGWLCIISSCPNQKGITKCLAGLLAIHINWSKCCLCCLDVNQGGTNHNRCTEICDLACTNLLINHVRNPKAGQSELLYGSKLPATKSRHIQPFLSKLSLTVHGITVLQCNGSLLHLLSEQCDCTHTYFQWTDGVYMTSQSLHCQLQDTWTRNLSTQKNSGEQTTAVYAGILQNMY